MITIEKVGSAIKFTFDDNQHYLYEGTIEIPVNSLTLVVDKSDMFSFRKAQSNDIFISANYDDIGMTKEQLIQFYKNNMVASNGESSISEIYVGCPNDSVDANTGVVTKNDCEKKDQLCIVYKDQQGYYSMTKVSLNEFILENEFEDGLYVDSGGTVHGVVDPRSEMVYTAYTSASTPSASANVLTVNESGFTVHNIQKAIDEKSKAAIHKVERKAEYVWDSTKLKMVLKLYDEDEDLINAIEWFDTNADGEILLLNRQF